MIQTFKPSRKINSSLLKIFRIKHKDSPLDYHHAKDQLGHVHSFGTQDLLLYPERS